MHQEVNRELTDWLNLAGLSCEHDSDTQAFKQRATAIGDWPIDDEAQSIMVRSVEEPILEEL
jgi:hypothetical protein